MAKAGLSGTGDVASQRKAGSGIQRLGKGINELLQGAEVLALAIAEIHQTKAGKGKRVLFRPHGLVISNGERVGAGHLGAACCAWFRRRVRLAGCWAA